MVGKSIRTIRRDMQNGKVSAQTDHEGRRVFDVSELIRAYGEIREPGTEAAQETPERMPSLDIASIEALSALKVEKDYLTRERDNLSARVERLERDLSAERDNANSERDRLLRLIEQKDAQLAGLLTDQSRKAAEDAAPEAPQEPQQPVPDPTKVGWFRRFTGFY